MNRDISFYVNFHIKEEHIDTWRDATIFVLENMKVEKTFICAYLHRDANDPAHFTLYEKWNESSMESFMKNQLKGKAYRKEYEKQLPQWSKCPRTFSNLEPLHEWHK